MSTTSTLTPLAEPIPSVRLGRAARERVGRFGRAVWQALENYGHARARRELMATASRYQTIDPAVAARLRALAD